MTAKIEVLKKLLREEDVPFFEDDTLIFWLERCGGDVELAAYHCLILKAEDTTLSVSGLSTADTSKYFRRLASLYRPNNTGILRGSV